MDPMQFEDVSPIENGDFPAIAMLVFGCVPGDLSIKSRHHL